MAPQRVAGQASEQVTTFADLNIDQDIIDADEDLSKAQEDPNQMSTNLPFLQEVAAVIEEIESIRNTMSDQARAFFGWRP